MDFFDTCTLCINKFKMKKKCSETYVLCKFKENQFKNVSNLVIFCFIICITCFLQFSPLFTPAFSRYEKCAMLSSPPHPETFCSIYTLWREALRFFLVFLYWKRLNSLRWLSSRCHLINSYASSLIFAFFSSVPLWKCNQNKTLGTV